MYRIDAFERSLSLASPCAQRTGVQGRATCWSGFVTRASAGVLSFELKLASESTAIIASLSHRMVKWTVRGEVIVEAGHMYIPSVHAVTLCFPLTTG